MSFSCKSPSCNSSSCNSSSCNASSCNASSCNSSSCNSSSCNASSCKSPSCNSSSCNSSSCTNNKKKHRVARGLTRIVNGEVTEDPTDTTWEYIDPAELVSHLKMRVTRAEIWECPLQGANSKLQLIGAVHQGIVIDMEDGNRYLVHKLPHVEKEGIGCAVVTNLSRMGKHWTKVDEKNVLSAKLDDYLEKCGHKYVWASDNCLHAVQRMWKLA